jgi:hypothetical protein
MELSRFGRPSFALTWAASSYGRSVNEHQNPNSQKLLARLSVGDELPWRVTRSGEPQWLVVTEVVDASRYRVRYPDGTTAELVDSD